MHSLANLNVPRGQLAIHWFGQSSFVLKDTSGTLLLIDPYFPHDRPADRFVHPEPPVDEAALPTDVVLLTHDHLDHAHDETLDRVNRAWPDAQYVGPSETMARVAGLRVDESRMATIAAGNRTELCSFTIHAVYAKPPEGVPAEGIEAPDTTHLGYVVAPESGPRVYVSGDPFHTLADHDEMLEPIRELRPEVGLITMHPTEGEFPDFAGAVKLAAKLQLKAAIPAHYDCFAARTFDPHAWARQMGNDGARPIIIAYDCSVLYHAQ